MRGQSVWGRRWTVTKTQTLKSRHLAPTVLALQVDARLPLTMGTGTRERERGCKQPLIGKHSLNIIHGVYYVNGIFCYYLFFLFDLYVYPLGTYGPMDMDRAILIPSIRNIPHPAALPRSGGREPHGGAPPPRRGVPRPLGVEVRQGRPRLLQLRRPDPELLQRGGEMVGAGLTSRRGGGGSGGRVSEYGFQMRVQKGRAQGGRG